MCLHESYSTYFVVSEYVFIYYHFFVYLKMHKKSRITAAVSQT
jgi:hypothetical protein